MLSVLVFNTVALVSGAASYGITHYFQNAGCQAGSQYMTLSMPVEKGSSCTAYDCRGPNNFGEYTQHLCSSNPATTYGVVMTEYDNNKCQGSFDLQFSVTNNKCSPSDDGTYQSFVCNDDMQISGNAECRQMCKQCDHSVQLDPKKCYQSNDGYTYLTYTCGETQAVKEGQGDMTKLLTHIAIGIAAFAVLAGVGYWMYKRVQKDDDVTAAALARPSDHQGIGDPLIQNGSNINS
eukprot:g78261.t1